MTEPLSAAASAEIIPFPSRRIPSPDAQERLRRAFQDLNEALDRQRAAVAGWRGRLEELNGVVAGLGSGLRRYRASLDSLSVRVGNLNAQAVQLERTADAILAVTQDSPG